jgi:hypothetical protein
MGAGTLPDCLWEPKGTEGRDAWEHFFVRNDLFVDADYEY